MSIETDIERMTGKKLPIDTLVEIGDALHDSTASFLLILEPLGNDGKKGKVTFSCHGEKSQIIDMFVKLLESNKELCEYLASAMIKASIENIIDRDINN